VRCDDKRDQKDEASKDEKKVIAPLGATLLYGNRLMPPRRATEITSQGPYDDVIEFDGRIGSHRIQ